MLVIGDSYSAGNGASGTTYGPADCYRNTTHWGERYAAGLREQGYAVTLTNHACSGGRTPDVHTPRPMDTQSEPDDAGAGRRDDDGPGRRPPRRHRPVQHRAFPAEEFWTYRATSVLAGTIVYDCTRTLRPQADFVTPETDLVVFTMGGNDAGFSTIVQGCFVVATRTAARAARRSRPLAPSSRPSSRASSRTWRRCGPAGSAPTRRSSSSATRSSRSTTGSRCPTWPLRSRPTPRATRCVASSPTPRPSSRPCRPSSTPATPAR